MYLTQKESQFLKEFREQEQLCADKYSKYSQAACSTELKALFSDLSECEKKHLKTIDEMSRGTVAPVPAPKPVDLSHCGNAGYADEQSRQNDAFLCRDMLGTEKHVSSTYDTGVFEFTDPQARQMLGHIQHEEQQHGERIYNYMKNNGMYSQSA